MPPMMNGGDPTHQGYPGQPPSVPPNSSQSPLPLTPEVPPLPSLNISSPVPDAPTPAASGKMIIIWDCAQRRCIRVKGYKLKHHVGLQFMHARE